MVFGNKKYRRIRLAVHPKAPFRNVLRVLEGLELPDTGMNAEHIKYALLEMINNSLRAHRNNDIGESVCIHFELLDPPQRCVRIAVRDRGPGFDPQSLPYSLEEDPASIDLDSSVFREYRKKNNYQRFGMGLPLVLRTFDTFSIEFLDEDGKTISWNPEHVRGTSITVSKNVTRGRSDGE